MDPDFEEHFKELLKQWVVDEVSIKERLDEMTELLKEAIANPPKNFKAGDKAVAEYSDALKESIKSQTEYLAQASPTMSNVRTDHIFTNILMQHGRKPVEDLDLKRKERLRQYGQISGKQIKSSQEIFIPTNGKHPESVLVTGKAGIGKTLFCQKLIKDWADNKLFRSRANAEVPDLKFAYLLTFRQLNLLGDDPVTLKDILNRSSVLDDRSNIDDSIFEYILHHSEEVLIIIDGYDECSQREYITSNSDEKYPNNAKEKIPVAALCAKLIKGKILRGSIVTITSRPDESDEMKAKDIYFDRYVEITGFSEPQVKEYIGKYFKNNDRMKNMIMDHITKNVNLVSFAHIPVLCFLMCSYFEYTLQQPKKNNPLPVKASDLYDEVVNMFVQKHDRKKRASVEETLDELSKLAAQLLLEKKFLFLKEDLKTLNLHELESLCGSGLLHCGPPFRTSFSATTKHFCFTHLTLQEYLAARWFVKTKEIPPENVSTQVVLFMSGILSKEKNNTFVKKLIIKKIISDSFTNTITKGLLISKCLLQYEDIEVAKEIVKKFRHLFCPRVGHFDLSGFGRANVDCITVSFALNVFGALNAEDESEWSRITTLSLSDRNVANFASLCQALQTPTCKVTKLDLRENQITDAGVASLCQALQTTACQVTELNLRDNQITDAGVASLCQALQTVACQVTILDLSDNQITDAGVVTLCQALQTPSCQVTKLVLIENQITDAGVASLCLALQTVACKVTELNLSYNQVTDAGVASLCQALQTPACKVTTLRLNGNQVTDAGVVTLCQTLQRAQCPVEYLSLYSNFQITSVGKRRLKKLSKRHSNLDLFVF
ncbi:NACHT, LRR and PYD domains-containing protein 12-like isoform X1 [Pocillopora damicornis]|uniref:NACHT, LRR and PYD domains-containing protein 12-like isoform X1 n=1 Tax=Pocillopora damicornis TaxID=46731 RepID=UPI000F559B6F|nr:NACHT, LRR and PYD domains-containing protein 12-like isoform X1 [Pocillopora damicornis]